MFIAEASSRPTSSGLRNGQAARLAGRDELLGRIVALQRDLEEEPRAVALTLTVGTVVPIDASHNSVESVLMMSGTWPSTVAPPLPELAAPRARPQSIALSADLEGSADLVARVRRGSAD
jgi:hypothetical protein